MLVVLEIYPDIVVALADLHITEDCADRMPFWFLYIEYTLELEQPLLMNKSTFLNELSNRQTSFIP